MENVDVVFDLLLNLIDKLIRFSIHQINHLEQNQIAQLYFDRLQLFEH